MSVDVTAVESADPYPMVLVPGARPKNWVVTSTALLRLAVPLRVTVPDWQSMERTAPAPMAILSLICFPVVWLVMTG